MSSIHSAFMSRPAVAVGEANPPLFTLLESRPPLVHLVIEE